MFSNVISTANLIALFFFFAKGNSNIKTPRVDKFMQYVTRVPCEKLTDTLYETKGYALKKSKWE